MTEFHAEFHAEARPGPLADAEAGDVPEDATQAPDEAGGLPSEVAGLAESVARLDVLADLPVAEHVSRYDEVHGQLQDALAAIDGV